MGGGPAAGPVNTPPAGPGQPPPKALLNPAAHPATPESPADAHQHGGGPNTEPHSAPPGGGGSDDKPGGLAERLGGGWRPGQSRTPGAPGVPSIPGAPGPGSPRQREIERGPSGPGTPSVLVESYRPGRVATAEEAQAQLPIGHEETGSGRGEPLLLEVAWEVCNQLGGIYTVLRSKAPAMVEKWGNRYFLVGPYNPQTAAVEFEPMPLVGAMGQVVRQMREMGFGAHYGRWLVTSRPHVVLLQYLDVFKYLHEVKYKLWKDHGIGTPPNDPLINNVVAFGEIVRLMLMLLAQRSAGRRPLLAHFHEWMAGAAIPMLRRDNWPGSIIFTTHATVLGRFLAMNDTKFYDHLPFYNADEEARKFNSEPQYRLERAAAHGSHVFTTVSDVTAEECRHLLGRVVDKVVPNGLNIQRFSALHEFQNLHRVNKEKIHEFTMGHFFPSYNFDLDKTLYFYTSGRYEYRNKGMDLTIEALARLNHWLKACGSDLTIVAFIITRQPVRSINVTALQSSAMLDEFRTITDSIKDQIGKALFNAAAAGSVPDLNTLVEEYWLLRLRRTIHAWRRDLPPTIVTHDLIDDQHDQVLNQLRACQLWNQKGDPVKVIYHPEFITPTNPLFGMEYDNFVRGCHLGIFPSYYEPWGYTPLESVALGVPAITSDLSGFGAYLMRHMPDFQERGLYVLRRRYASWNDSAQQLAQMMFDFAQLNRRQRINLRNQVESFADHFDWHNLARFYHDAHAMAMQRFA